MRILLTSVSSGSGHTRAAEALRAAFEEAHPEVTVEHVNVLDHIHQSIRTIYEDGYALLADRAPAMWRLLYDGTDKRGNDSGVQDALNIFQRKCAAPFLGFVHRWKPDAILSTHFLTAQLLSSGVERTNIPLEVAVTDYDLHRLWINRSVRRYYVADETLVTRAQELGLHDGVVVPTGIPIHPSFCRLTSRLSVLESMNLDEGTPTVLLLSGGMGVGNVEEVFRSLLEIKQPLQIVTVAGRNEALRKRLDATPIPSHIRCRHFGFVTTMADLMSAADVVVTKSGGLTTAESLAKGVPMVVFLALPGQETKNAEFVESVGGGFFVKQGFELKNIVERLVSSPGERFRYQIQSRAAGKPRAAFDIAHNLMASLFLVP